MENVTKIYRHINPASGFDIEAANPPSICMDEQMFNKLLQFINKQFLICLNRQSSCLIQGQVDSNSIVSLLAVLMVLPVIIGLLSNCYTYLFWEYSVIFLIVGYKLFIEFQKSSKMSQQYCLAGLQLDQIIADIIHQFNTRFSYLEMSYHQKTDQDKRDYLQIKVIKEPFDSAKLKSKLINKMNNVYETDVKQGQNQ